ncbi:MAG TPA: carbohydrate ABC transporter permease [Spirochaetia bacterium]|jgi:raffinose/stachyose/melibiose transport system permease protein|nr:carbohydrate ABC transporter permease [Spirochaetia bacterium]
MAEKKPTWASWIALIVLAALTLLILSPFVIVAVNAFKTPSDYASNGPLALPSVWSLDSLAAFWERVDFTGKLWNSLVISTAVAVVGVLFALLNAFTLGIGRIRGRLWFLVLFILANTLPQETLAYPIYYFAKSLHIYGNGISVILVFIVIQGSFGTYLLSSVFSAFPREMVEAAQVDGATKNTLLWKIVAPVSLPTLAVLFTFFFIWTWNEFFLPLILLPSNAAQTVPIAISVTQGQHNMDATMASASALLGLLPCLLFFFAFQRTLTRGVTAGSIK